MAEILILYKKLGETPLECIQRFKESNPKYVDIKMEYLGRLDPMAEGLLLVRAGAGARDEYLALDKSYEFEVLWGFETDTYDVLGKLVSECKTPQKLPDRIPALLKKTMSRKTQSYPPYSSKPVGGKALFAWAREGKIGEIKIPERGIKILSLNHINTRLVSGNEILSEIEKRVALVNGDFRQEEILKLWRQTLEDRDKDLFLVSKLSADVSSGTYIRGLAHDMGQMLDTCALAYNIKRTRVGDYKI